jgi:hypothetical protein
MILIDRSRIETYQLCPRLRFLRYHYGGRGFVPRNDSYYLAFGSLYHEALERLLLESMPIRDIIEQASGGLEVVIEKIGASGGVLPSLQYAIEQRYLIEGMLGAYARVRVPEVLRDYKVLSTEEELLWTIGEIDGQPLVDMLRLDALLQSNDTEAIYYKEYKTTSYGDERWALEFENNAQVMANLQALEQTKKIRSAGVLIEGHLKGRRRRDTARMSRYNGTEIQDSPFCYAYESGPGNVSLTWKSSAVRVGVWELGYSPAKWVSEYLNEDDCRKASVNLEPISPDPYALERWQRQTLLQETTVYRGLAELASTDSVERQRTILDQVFPLHETSCIRYGLKCSHYEVCHNAAVRSEPLASPLFIRRTPHHAAELSAMQAADREE